MSRIDFLIPLIYFTSSIHYLFISDKRNMTEPANKAGIVLFVDSFSWPKKKSPLQINYDAIDKWLFDKSSFNEVLGLDTHYHLYFDFDSISNDEEYQDVLNWLESLKDVFGP